MMQVQTTLEREQIRSLSALSPGKATPPPSKCLVVDASPSDAAMLVQILQNEGHAVRRVATGEAAVELCKQWQPSIVLLDWELPGIHGPRTARLLLETCNPFIVLVSHRSAEIDRVTTLSTIADDFVAKPYSPQELVARVRAILRRDHAGTTPTGNCTSFTVGALALDTATRVASVDGRPLDLTRLEFNLLTTLVRKTPAPVDRSTLIAETWGGVDAATTHTLDVHASRLRRKLAGGARGKVALEAVRGVGLRLTTGRF